MCVSPSKEPAALAAVWPLLLNSDRLLAKGNCVPVMRGGEEAGGKTGSRRTDVGYKASAVGQPGLDGDSPILFLFIARVDPWSLNPRA